MEKRLQQHALGLVKSTQARGPFTLVHLEKFSTKVGAMKREKFFKTGKGREWMQVNLGA